MKCNMKFGHLIFFITRLAVLLFHLCGLFTLCTGLALCKHKLHRFNYTLTQTVLNTHETFTQFSVQTSESCKRGLEGTQILVCGTW